MSLNENQAREARENPYESPKTEGAASTSGAGGGPSSFGKPCPKCQSSNTSGDGELAAKPGVIQTIFFGFYYILIRGAFARKAINCNDCGETSYYKTTGSKIAMGILTFVVSLAILAYFFES